jgi:hypothetical protein
MDAQLEDKFTLSRQTIFNLLQASSAFNPQAVKVFIDVFKDLPDCRQHGPIVWALMIKGEVFVAKYSFFFFFENYYNN